MPFELDIITLFPDMFDAITRYGVTSQAYKKKIFRLNTWNPRNFTANNYRTIDDNPYGGGPGMVMLAEPLDQAIATAKKNQAKLGIQQPKVIYLSPQGKLLDHQQVLALSKHPGLILLCGRYEGIDERLLISQVDMEVSIGNYVISGGELAAMVLIDCIVRHLPGTLGNPQSANQDSFSNCLLDFPQFTRPEVYKGTKVPEILMSGDHTSIKRWRLQQSLGKTWLKRPDLLKTKFAHGITEEEENLLEQFKQSYKQN